MFCFTDKLEQRVQACVDAGIVEAWHVFEHSEWEIRPQCFRGSHDESGVSPCLPLCMLGEALQGHTETKKKSLSYLVKSPFGVSQKCDAMSVSDTDGHSSEAGSWRVPRSLSFQRFPVRHWTWGVVRAAGICLQGILKCDRTETLACRFILE